jgi:hypothetical protein
MKCAVVTKEIRDAVVTGSNLTAGAAEHIKTCRACAARYSKAAAVNAAMAKLGEDVKLPHDFEARVFNKLGIERSGLRAAFERLFLQARPALAAAAAMVIIAVVALYNLQVQPAKNTMAGAATEDKIPAGEAQKIAVKRDIIKEEAAEQSAHGASIAQTREVKNTGTQVLAEKDIDTANLPRQIDTLPKYAEPMTRPAPKLEAAVIVKQTPGVVGQETPVDSLSGNIEVRNNVINPARGETVTVRYRVTGSYKTRIAVFSKSGRSVRLLVNENMEPGIYSCAWDGTTDEGSVTGAGLYIIAFESGNIKEKVKVAVVK